MYQYLFGISQPPFVSQDTVLEIDVEIEDLEFDVEVELQ